MMNQLRKIAIGVLALLVTAVTTSCQGFLDETQKTKRDTDYFKTEQGLIDLSVAMYFTFKAHWGQEWTISFNQYGTDEFWVGGDNSNHDWNDYTQNLSPYVIAINSNTTQPHDLWDNMYVGINSANIIITTADEVVQTEEVKTRIKGEAYFVRAHNYFKLVKQFGGVPLKLEPSIGVERYFTRATAEECMSQIFADFEEAYRLLPSTPAKMGKLYKDVAAHFLAKAHLFRASEINNDWNSAYKDNDLTKVISYCDEVIAKHPLANSFQEIWDYLGPDGANEQLPEIIFAAQMTDDKATVPDSRAGNTQHFYYTAQYQNLVGCIRDIAGGREYQRLKTSEYMFDVYDLENDSRFWKSFRTKVNLNNPKTVSQLTTKDGVEYKNGELGAIYIINPKGDQRFSLTSTENKPNASFQGPSYISPESGKYIPHVFVRYLSDGSTHMAGIVNRWPTMSKWLDGSRESVATGQGNRDGIMARVSDTYLTKAEALIRQHKYAEALEVINIVRDRAAFKAGEERDNYTDGGHAFLYNTTGQTAQANQGGIESCTFTPHNSYYESLQIAKTTDPTSLTVASPAQLPAVDEAIIQKLGYSSDYDRMMCFLLNERSRELVGEYYRWEDLARTKTLIARVKAFNPEARDNITEKHYLRPIPQTFLDAIQNEEGRALTAEEKKAMQNPGY